MFEFLKKKPNTINSLTEDDFFKYAIYEGKGRLWFCRQYGCSREEFKTKVKELYEIWKQNNTKQ